MTNQLNDDQIRNSQLDEIRDSGFKENNALRVHSYLRANDRARSRRLPRWIWELLQNALDASIAHDDPLTVKIEYNLEELIFLHNGSSFEEKQIFNLIYHGSTKADQEEAIGEYGSGFLTTHLLSPEIKISGQLSSNEWFDFCLTRKSDSRDALLHLMDEAWENFKESLSTSDQSIPASFTTRFIYPIIGKEAQEAVEKGIETLKQCTPFVLVFNSKFSSIDIDNHGKTLRFEVIKRRSIDASEIQHITVATYKNGNSNENEYVLISDKKKTSVAVPLASNSNGLACQPVKKIPRLFKAVPLVGTESFSFPAIINSLDFKPSEDRDDVYIGLGNDEANTKNQSAIEKSCELLVHLLQYAASEGWHYVHHWAEVPTLQHPTEETREWIRTCVKGKLIERIRETPTILNSHDKGLKPIKAFLPVQENIKEIETLWDLLNGLKITNEKLPRRNEAMGWCEAVRSWACLYDKEPTEKNDKEPTEKTVNGQQLANHVHEKMKKAAQDKQHISELGLNDDVEAIRWLNKLIDFLQKNGLTETIRTCLIVPDQDGFLHSLDDLYRDIGIDEELKNIAYSIDWYVRRELRNDQITSLSKEKGAGEADNKFILGKLIEKLRELTENNSDDNNFKEASTRLFAWIVDQEDWKSLGDVSVFTKDNSVHRSLSSVTSKKKRPLAPVQAWCNELQQYSDLFPPERILDDAFFDVLRDPTVWQKLDTEKIIHVNMVVPFDGLIELKCVSPEIYESDHKAMEPISGTQVVAWKEIMERVKNDSVLARLFWQFLTDWLIKEDVRSLKAKEVKCKSCNDDITHKYYPNLWLKAVREEKWIPQGNKYVHATEKSIANLLSDCGLGLGSLDENSTVVEFLLAMDLDLPDLKLKYLMAGNAEKRDDLYKSMELVQQLPAEILDQMCSIVSDSNEDENLIEDFKALIKDKHILRENQRFGQQVEDLVERNLKDNSFSVSRTGRGSDFEISTEDLITLNIGRGNQSWLVEVKATRTGTIQMTPTQAQTAVEKAEGFLLCIVPIESDNTMPDLENVKKNMRFVKNMGEHVAPWCQKLKELEDLRKGFSTEDESGIKLVCEAGTSRFHVNNLIWQNEGIPLENLVEHLK